MPAAAKAYLDLDDKRCWIVSAVLGGNMGICRASVLGITVLLVACGKPDASGIYIATTDREVTLVQLIQASDGNLSGRLEATTIDPDGAINRKEAAIDGSVSGHDLMLRPASAWFGGIQASGTFSGRKLTLTGNGSTLNADRSSLEKYQAAIVNLQTVAREQRQQIAGAQAVLAHQQAQERADKEMADRLIQVSNIASRLRFNTGKLNEAISSSPNFAQLAAANTARVVQLVKRANGQSDLARNQLAVAANQIEVDTNQIEVARSQYALLLNDIVEDADQAATPLGKLCGPNPPAKMVKVCGDANGAADGFKGAYLRGRTSFTPYKKQVQMEMDRQNALSQRIDGS